MACCSHRRTLGLALYFVFYATRFCLEPLGTGPMVYNRQVYYRLEQDVHSLQCAAEKFRRVSSIC